MAADQEYFYELNSKTIGKLDCAHVRQGGNFRKNTGTLKMNPISILLHRTIGPKNS